MHRVTNRRVRSSGVGGELNVLLNCASKVALRSKKASVRSSYSCMHVDVGDYVHGILLRQAMRGERNFKEDILRHDGVVVEVAAISAGLRQAQRRCG